MGGYRWSGNTVFTDLTVDGDTVIVDETNNRVGIGTDSPSKPLDVDGEILAKGQLEVNDTTTSSASTGGSLRLSANDGAAMVTLTGAAWWRLPGPKLAAARR